MKWKYKMAIMIGNYDIQFYRIRGIEMSRNRTKGRLTSAWILKVSGTHLYGGRINYRSPYIRSRKELLRQLRYVSKITSVKVRFLKRIEVIIYALVNLPVFSSKDLIFYAEYSPRTPSSSN